MLSKKQRFSRTTFPTTRPLSRRSFSWGTVSIYEGAPGVAVVVSKKTLKKAHDRNRAKRRVYAALHNLPLTKGIVVHLRREALTESTHQITENLQTALR